MRVLLILAVTAFAAGCAGYRSGFLPYGDAPLAPREVGAPVAILRGEPDRPHREIGQLVVEGGSLDEMDALRAEMVRKAVSVGADAVKLVRIGFVRDDHGFAVHGAWSFAPYGYPGWGWYGGYPAWSYRGNRRTPLLSGIAIVWQEPDPSR